MSTTNDMILNIRGEKPFGDMQSLIVNVVGNTLEGINHDALIRRSTNHISGAKP
jgi:hypothetical protein